MKTQIALTLAMAGIFTSSMAFGNVNTIQITSVNGTQDSRGEYVGPYFGPFTGVQSSIFCDDLNHTIGINAAPLNVNVSHVSDLTLTRFGGPLAATSLVARADYEQIFYLSSFLATPNLPSPYPTFTGGINSANSSVAADVQDAMWTYFAPNAANAGTNQVNYWMAQAGANYQKFNYSSFSILTDSGNQYGGTQELFVNSNPKDGLTPTPEPGLWGIMAAGVGVLGVCLQRRRRAGVNV